MRTLFLSLSIVLFAFLSYATPNAEAQGILPECTYWKAKNFGACVGLSESELDTCLENRLDEGITACQGCTTDEEATLVSNPPSCPPDITAVAEDEIEAILKWEIELTGDARTDPFLGIIKEFINWLMMIATSIVVVMLVYAGYKYIESSLGGTEDGKNIAKNAIIGFLISVLAYAIVQAIIEISLGIGV